MEQFAFNFEASSQTTERSVEELAGDYRALVGVPPRTTDRAALLAALEDPEAERLRLRAEDAESDHEEIERTYRRA